MATVFTISVDGAFASIPVSGGGTRNIAWDGKTVPQHLYGLEEVVRSCISQWLDNGNSSSVDYTISASS